MKQIFYLISISLIFFSCAKANKPLEIDNTQMGYEITNIYSTKGIAKDVEIGENAIFVAEDQYGFSIFDKNTAVRLAQVDTLPVGNDYFDDIKLLALSENTDTLWVYK
ncbi:MAG: hypothetical protein U9N34_07445, partial [Candidatus Cloacimonadota bacterium]|nr:hypothetical protein [Candidatus Cloacimonadota bacterium]